MYIDNENFDKWMERLSKKLSEIGQDLKSLINTNNILDENDKILDNQDLAFLLKVSFRTLQRYRASGRLPYFMISHKTYYRAADIRTFIKKMLNVRPTNGLKQKINLINKALQNRVSNGTHLIQHHRSSFSRNHLALWLGSFR